MVGFKSYTSNLSVDTVYNTSKMRHIITPKDD
ncbi:hypothetical protein SB6419_00763 [Klebsiella spallanzanii]|nr:hypothetical protein SB6419_00763 [Klebsiella spallanzanii]